MIQGFIAVAITAAVMATILLGRATTWHRDSVNIHIHDTYFILPYWVLAIFVVSVLGFVFGATAAFCHAFKKAAYNWIAIAGLLGIAVLWLYTKGFFKQ